MLPKDRTRVLIVDDEPLARARLRRLLEGQHGVTVVAEAASGDEALAASDQLAPDVVFMDIRMPGLDGLSAAHRLAQRPQAPAVVFCTAYDDYAIEAFEANAIGYLLKPVSEEKLALALAKAERLSVVRLGQLAAAAPAGPALRTHLSARSRRGVELLPLAEARYFLADHKYVTVYHPAGELLIDDTLRDLEEEFGDLLLRVHRNALVCVDHIIGLDRTELGQYRVRLAGIEHGPQVSRRHLALVRKRLAEL
jgi:two-component system response regulator AlgR